MGLAFMTAILAEESRVWNYKNQTGSVLGGATYFLSEFH
jgi:hypothetical protein